MVSNVQKHSKVPSFFAKSTAKAQEIDLEWNGTNYSATLTDTNNVLGNFTFSADASGISFSVSGNKLTITADKAPSGTVGITATKTGSVRKGVIIWTDGVYAPGQGQQDLSTYAAEVNDPVRGYLNIAVSLGAAKIVKTSEDGNVSGISFTITGNGVNQKVKTGSNGEITISKLVEGLKFHLYGTSLSGIKVDEYAVTDADGIAYFSDVLIGTGYTIEEVDTPVRYVIPESQTADIEWNKVTEKSFENILKKWRADVFKYFMQRYRFDPHSFPETYRSLAQMSIPHQIEHPDR